MSEYVGRCLIMLEYARLNLNEWLLFHVPIEIHCLLCLLILTKFIHSLKEHEAVLLKRKNLVLD